MYSIRRRLVLLLAASFAILVAVAGLQLDRLLSERLERDFDTALTEKAQMLGSMIEQEPDQFELDYAEGTMPEFEREEKPQYFQVWVSDGRLLYRSARLGARDLPFLPGVANEAYHRDVELPDGRPGRMVRYRFVPKGPESDDDEDDEPDSRADDGPAPRAAVMVVARSRERLDRLLASVRWLLALAGGGVALLAGVVVWGSLRRGLRPLDQVAAQVEALDASSLDARVALPVVPRELAPVVNQINALLKRLERSFERERRFSANVSHELRTPLAELRSLAEVGSRWPDDVDSVTGFFGDVREIGTRMERLVHDLLLLARCEAGVERADHALVDLREVVESCWSRLAHEADAKNLRFLPDLDSGLLVLSDPGKVEIIVCNLLANAVHHSQAGDEISCAGRVDRGQFEIEISNRASGLRTEDVEFLCERFWRKDPARSGGDRIGIGLSLVSALNALLGLELSLRLDEAGVFRASLSGPVATPEPAGEPR